MNANGTKDFQDFINDNPRYRILSNNLVAQQVFDDLSDLNAINSMIVASNSDKPALSACAEIIEQKYSTQNTFDLHEDFTRQAVGAMIKEILEPFGYRPVKNKRLSKDINTRFTSAAVYQLNSVPVLKLVPSYTVERAD